MMGVFTIKDTAADAFNLPFFSHTKATAEREFRRLVGDPQSQLFHNPQDFALYQIGLWNEELGIIVASESPELVILASAIGAKEVK